MIIAAAITSWMIARFSSAPTTAISARSQLDGILDHLTRERDRVGALRRVAVHGTSRHWSGAQRDRRVRRAARNLTQTRRVA